MIQWRGLATIDGRFYIVRHRGYVSLFDTRNRLAGGVTCDSVREAKALAERIARWPN